MVPNLTSFPLVKQTTSPQTPTGGSPPSNRFADMFDAMAREQKRAATPRPDSGAPEKVDAAKNTQKSDSREEHTQDETPEVAPDAAGARPEPDQFTDEVGDQVLAVPAAPQVVSDDAESEWTIPTAPAAIAPKTKAAMTEAAVPELKIATGEAGTAFGKMAEHAPAPTDDPRRAQEPALLRGSDRTVRAGSAPVAAQTAASTPPQTPPPSQKAQAVPDAPVLQTGMAASVSATLKTAQNGPATETAQSVRDPLQSGLPAGTGSAAVPASAPSATPQPPAHTQGPRMDALTAAVAEKATAPAPQIGEAALRAAAAGQDEAVTGQTRASEPGAAMAVAGAPAAASARFVRNRTQEDLKAPVRVTTADRPAPPKIAIPGVEKPLTEIKEGEEAMRLSPLFSEARGQGQTSQSAAAFVSVRGDHGASVMRQMVAVSGQLQDGPVELRLNPEELGRVRMHMVASDQGIVLHITSERPETLDLMRRNIDQLHRELSSLGYARVDFTFGQQGGNSGFGAGTGPDSGASANATARLASEDPSNAPLTPLSAARDGLDIRL